MQFEPPKLSEAAQEILNVGNLHSTGISQTSGFGVASRCLLWKAVACPPHLAQNAKPKLPCLVIVATEETHDAKLNSQCDINTVNNAPARDLGNYFIALLPGPDVLLHRPQYLGLKGTVGQNADATKYHQVWHLLA
jgi:hypothetical protein